MSKCLHCGGETALGILAEQHDTRFRPHDAPFFTLTSNDVKMDAWMCFECGRVELRGDAAKLRVVLKR